MSDCVSCAEKDQQLAEKDAQIAELLAQIEQLKSSSAAAYDTNHKFIELGAPFDDFHIGRDDQEMVEQDLVNQLPAFATLFKADAKFYIQIKQKTRYDAFLSFKKRLFWHFWEQYEAMLEREPAANAYFSKVSRAVALRVVCDLADTDNEPTGTQDCWIASSKLVNAQDRAILTFNSNSLSNTTPFAHRFACWLKFGFTSLTYENKNEASHLCDNNICLRHVFPEQSVVNKSRISCHRAGCAKDCEHEPTCQYQSNGVHLPCRSNPELEDCECELECFEGVVRKVEVTGEPVKKKRKKREVNLENWTPVGPIALTAGMLEQNVARPRLWFNQRRYSIKNVGQKGTSYKCFRDRTGNCTGTAKISDEQVMETRPHSPDCALVTTFPF